MLGTNALSAVLGNGLKSDCSLEEMQTYLKVLASMGMHIVFAHPNTKIPDDLRTSAHIKADDLKHKEIYGPHTIAPQGLYLATDKIVRINAYAKEYVKRYPNQPWSVGIEVGRSRLVIVDVDTLEQKHAFQAWWYNLEKTQTGRDIPEIFSIEPTVSSPGVQDENGKWVHKDGGHYYFTLDESEVLPGDKGKAHINVIMDDGIESGFDIFWNYRFILIPPSARKEGSYKFQSPVMNLPASFYTYFHEIDSAAIARRVRAEALRGAGGDDIFIEWYREQSWRPLLQKLNWTLTGTDTCGCEIWGRPGGASRKSATAHSVGCALSRYSREDPPIHFWTSEPGTVIQNMLNSVSAKTGELASTLSKLQLYAAVVHGGDVSAASRNLSVLNEDFSLGEFFSESNAPTIVTVDYASFDVPSLKKKLI